MDLVLLLFLFGTVPSKSNHTSAASNPIFNQQEKEIRDRIEARYNQRKELRTDREKASSSPRVINFNHDENNEGQMKSSSSSSRQHHPVVGPATDSETSTSTRKYYHSLVEEENDDEEEVGRRRGRRGTHDIQHNTTSHRQPHEPNNVDVAVLEAEVGSKPIGWRPPGAVALPGMRMF